MGLATQTAGGVDDRDASPMASSGACKLNRAPLRECVHDTINDYFSDLDGYPSTGLYRMVIAEVEAPLLASVLRYVRNNQSKAARLLGITRTTLRKKIRQYQLG
jgi:Fis family transcriptional regulator